jgi:hypothetical protein
VAAELLFLYLDRVATDPSEPGVARSVGVRPWASVHDAMPEGTARPTVNGVLIKREGKWQPYQ